MGEEGFGAASEVNAGVVVGALDGAAGEVLGEGAATEGDDLIVIGEDALGNEGFGFAEGLLAVILPDLRDGGAVEMFDDEGVSIDEGLVELLGEDLADGCFAGAAVAEKDGVHGG